MLVSVITPCHRKEDLPNVICNFTTQTYSEKELILVVPASSFIPDITDKVFRYIYIAPLGDLRNYAVQQAKGKILLHMDSDDHYAPEYITQSVNTLIQSGADLVGLNTCTYIDNGRKYIYDYRGTQKLVLGATMCYWRTTWENHPFRSMQVGEDNVFCAMTRYIAYGDYTHLFTAIRRGNNTSHPDFRSSSFRRI